MITSLLAKEPETDLMPKTDTIESTIVPIIAYPVGKAVPADSLDLHSGDSIFVFDGELFFRARIKGQDFFVSQREIMARSDSLVVYQNFRIRSTAQGAADTLSRKAERQRCTMITKNGSRCKRQAMPGSDRCWQHKR